MINKIPQEEMNILFEDRNLAEGVHMLSVAGAWPSIKVMNSMLKGGAKRASQISEETNLGVQDVLDTLKDLETTNLVKCKFNEEERANYWTLKNNRFTISLAGDKSGINIFYSTENKPKGYLTGLWSGIRKCLNLQSWR